VLVGLLLADYPPGPLLAAVSIGNVLRSVIKPLPGEASRGSGCTGPSQAHSVPACRPPHTQP